MAAVVMGRHKTQPLHFADRCGNEFAFISMTPRTLMLLPHGVRTLQRLQPNAREVTHVVQVRKSYGDGALAQRTICAMTPKA